MKIFERFIAFILNSVPEYESMRKPELKIVPKFNEDISSTRTLNGLFALLHHPVVKFTWTSQRIRYDINASSAQRKCERGMKSHLGSLEIQKPRGTKRKTSFSCL